MSEIIDNLFYFRRPGAPGNFGDELSPIIVAAMLRSKGILPPWQAGNRLLAVGSILHFAGDGDTVWGSGVNGKIAAERHSFSSLDVRSVRGPLSAEFLEKRGVRGPEVFGDPGLLLADLIPVDSFKIKTRRNHVIMPNYNDLDLFAGVENLLSPLLPVQEVIGTILGCDLVVASALHGIIAAEAYGVPARLLLAPGHTENVFKYRDYYEGTGRPGFMAASSLAEALEMGGEPAPIMDPEKLKEAFPFDLFSKKTAD